MNKENFIKAIIIAAVILGQIFVWTFPYDQHPYLPELIGGPEKPTSIESNENVDNQNQEPDVDNQNQELDEEEIDQTKIEKAEDTGLLILVNKNYYLDENYKPADLAPIEYFAEDRSAEARFMRTEAADHFNQMMLAGRGFGFEIVMTTAYRSYGFQAVLYNNYVANYGQAEANKYSAKPGHSEHQTGLAVDVTASTVGYALTAEFDQTEEWQWLDENAADFGFILRYPKGKSEITGYMYEPWHFRYVGIEAAKDITEREITLEEYIDK